MLTTVIVLIVVAVPFLVGVVSYNQLVRLRNHVASAWARTIVQLTRRHDLVPNLIDAVKGYAAHEDHTLEAVVQARNTAVAAQQSDPASQAHTEDVLSGALRQLFAVSEAYPDLKANTNFLSLQQELASTEDHLSLARQIYNDAVATYIIKVQAFPSTIIARMFRFKSPEYFEAEAGASAAPAVQF